MKLLYVLIFIFEIFFFKNIFGVFKEDLIVLMYKFLFIFNVFRNLGNVIFFFDFNLFRYE